MVPYTCRPPGASPDRGGTNAKSEPYLQVKPFTSQLAHRGFCSSPFPSLASLTGKRTMKRLSPTFSPPFAARQTARPNPLLARGCRFPGHGVSIVCMTPDCEEDQKRDLEAPLSPKSALGSRRAKSGSVVGRITRSARPAAWTAFPLCFHSCVWVCGGGGGFGRHPIERSAIDRSRD
jgi:hypothetical protein